MYPNACAVFVQQHPVIKQPRSGVTWRPLLRGRTRLPPLLWRNNCNPHGNDDEEDVRDDMCCCVSAGTGILSSLPEENPHWWNANMV